MQELAIVGNVTRDPESRFLANGTQVTNFSVAVNKKWTSADGEKKQSVTYFEITAWRQQAKLCAEYLSKGSKVLCKCTDMVASTYTSRDGKACVSVKWTLEKIIFLGGGKGGQGVESYDEGDVKQVSITNPGDLDDIPF